MKKGIFGFLLASLLILTGCGNNEPKFIDYVHTSDVVKLDVDYKDRNFFEDGIAEVTLRTAIDGDTAHFNLVNVKPGQDTFIKSRYYGIDTPESTGKVQPYGYEASEFNKEKLMNAKNNGTIVVSTPGDGYKKPVPDSTGSRFVSMIWINETVKNAPFDSLVLLNLWIVQEGLSWVKSLGDAPKFKDTFLVAEQQAKDFKLNLHSGKPSPHYNYGGYEDVSVLEIAREVQACIKDPTHVNAFDNRKVRIQGTVTGFANSILYIQNYFSAEEVAAIDGIPVSEAKGEYAGINIYTGMSPINSRYKTVNAYLEICGLAKDSENFGFQITDASFPESTYFIKENDCRVLIKPEDNVESHKVHEFTFTSTEMMDVYNSTNLEPLFSRVTLTTPVTCNYFKKSDSGDITLGFKELSSDKGYVNAYITGIYKGNPNDPVDIWDTEEDFKGKKFYINAVYTTHKTTSTSKSGEVTTKINFQFAIGANAELKCTDYYNA